MAHQEEDPKNGLILVIGLGSLVTLVAVMFGLASYYDMLRDKEQQSKILGVDNPALLALRADEDKKLTQYAAIGADKKRIRIPIERAMQLMAQKGRDAIPSIQPDPANAVIAPAGGAAPAPSASAATPAASGSAAPADAPKKDEKKDEKKKDDKH